MSHEDHARQDDQWLVIRCDGCVLSVMDNTFARYTPQGEASFVACVTTKPFGPEGESEARLVESYGENAEKISFVINNPALVGQFKPGQAFYIDFTPAE